MMNVFRTLLAVGLVAAVGAAPAAKLYKWIDAEGRVSYHDTPPPEGSSYRVEEKTVRTGAGAAASTKAEEAARRFPVVLYSASKCDACDLARGYLEKRKVPFSEKNVESDMKLQDELKAKSGALSVPTIVVGDKVMRGYLQSLLEGELDQAGYPKAAAGETEEKASAESGGLAPTR